MRRGKAHGEYLPHKPLLLLYALGQLADGKEQIPFRDVDVQLGRLLKEFGPHRAKYHPEYPFWWLQTDTLWEVSSRESLERRKGGTIPKKSELIEKDATGSIPGDVRQVLLSDEQYIGIVARKVLERSFPQTIHQDILDAVGLTLAETARKAQRSRNFRRMVLRAYEYRCSVCGYDLRLVGNLAGLEAAHIMWRQVGGPDTVSNGLALCVLHHKIFDLGAFTVDTDGQTVVCSQEISGSTRKEWLLDFHGSKLRMPQSIGYTPGQKYLEWHRDTIFKGPSRELR